jgi:hypothetical protein
MKIESEDLLLSEKLAPITTSMGFIEAETDYVVDGFIEWREEIITKAGWKRIVEKRSINGNLDAVLRSLLPLRMGDITKFLFIPTTSKWTAYISNGYRGTDPSVIGYLAERLQCRTIWIVANPHTLQKTGIPRRGRQGALIFELYGPAQGEWLNLIRQIRLDNNAGKWEFEQSGEPLSFENVEGYKAKKVSERFSFELFNRYLHELRIDPFREDFYLAGGADPCFLVQLKGDLPKTASNVSLKRARRLNGIEDGLRFRGKLISRSGYF